MKRDPHWARWTLLAIVSTSFATIATASLSTSTTFDEIVMMAGGARGFQTGHWDIAPEHPPLGLYLYGLPIYLSGPNYPLGRDAPSNWRTGDVQVETRDFSFRYGYSRELFFNSGNNPVWLAFLGRLISAFSAVILVLLVHRWTRRRYDPATALFASGLVAFMPDVLAHGGVAYLDVPVTAGFLASLAMADSVVRKPSLSRGALTGALGALTVALKLSGLLLLPAVMLLGLMEGFGRGWNTKWLRSTVLASIAGFLSAYVMLVTAYRGDFALAGFRYAFRFSAVLTAIGHGYPSFLAGVTSALPTWHSYPLLFLYKTPLSLQLLVLLALIALVRSWRLPGRENVLLSRLRMPFVGIVVVAIALMFSDSLLAFRYAMPILPLVAIVTAVGVRLTWLKYNRPVRTCVSLCVLWFVVGSISWYPQFLPFSSVWAGGRDNGHRVMIASSLDWGQGLLELRRWMEESNVDRVWLSYYGSAMPHAYGVRYEPLPSFLELVPLANAISDPPDYTVISASNLQPVFLIGDPLERFRLIEPDTVLAHVMLVFRTGNAHPLERSGATAQATRQ